jgi:hypothetical protein
LSVTLAFAITYCSMPQQQTTYPPDKRSDDLGLNFSQLLSVAGEIQREREGAAILVTQCQCDCRHAGERERERER